MSGSKSSDWTPERRAKVSANIKARYADPACREAISAAMREIRAVERAKGIKRTMPEAHRERNRQRCREWNADPSTRAKRIERMKELWATKHYRERVTRSIKISSAFSTKPYRQIETLKALHRGNMKDPAKRAEIAARLLVARRSEKARENHKRATASPEYRAKLKCPRPRCGTKIPKRKWADYFLFVKKGFRSTEAVERLRLR